MAPGEDKKMSEDHNKGKLREGAVRCWCTAVRLARVPAGPEALRGCLVGKKQKRSGVAHQVRSRRRRRPLHPNGRRALRSAPRAAWWKGSNTSPRGMPACG